MSAPDFDGATLEISVQLLSRNVAEGINDWVAMGGLSPTTFTVVDDLTTCAWNLIQDVKEIDMVVSTSTFFSSIFEGYVVLHEGVTDSAINPEGHIDEACWNVTRKDAFTTLSFKLVVAHASTAFIQQEARLQAVDFRDDLTTVYTLTPGQYSTTVCAKLDDDILYHIERHCAFFLEFLPENSYGTAMDCIESGGCNA